MTDRQARWLQTGMRLRSLVLWCALFSACGGVEMSGEDAGSGGGGGAVGGGAGGGGGGGGAVAGGGGGTALGGGGGTATGGGGGSASCTDSWSTYGGTFFATYCTACHHHSGQFTTAAAVQGELAFVTQEIQYRYMPQGYVLSATEQARILAYLNCGAP